MKIIITCSSSKEGNYLSYQGLNVMFVANPDYCDPEGYSPFHPDDKKPETDNTWREEIVAINREGENRFNLSVAGKLYSPRIYMELIRHFSWENVYILSAGWGLVRSDFLLPMYDITFSSQAGRCNRRFNSDRFNDFNHLTDLSFIKNTGTLTFLGGKNYLPMYYELVRNFPIRKVIFYRSKSIVMEPGFKYLEYYTKQRINWHYSCAQDLINGKISL